MVLYIDELLLLLTSSRFTVLVIHSTYQIIQYIKTHFHISYINYMEIK